MDNPQVKGEIVGHTLELVWRVNMSGEETASGRKIWLQAEVTAYNTIAEKHTVVYKDDGLVEELDLLRAERDWRLLAMSL